MTANGRAGDPGRARGSRQRAGTLPEMPELSRRTFLLGSVAAVTLAACGSDGGGNNEGGDGGGGGEEGASTSDPGFPVGGGTSPNDIVLVRRFASNTLVTGSQRVPVVLGDINGLLPLESTPETLTARVLAPDGSVAVPSVTAERHGADLQQPYFPFALTLPTAGVYTLQLADDEGATTSVDVLDPADVAIPQVGDPLPPFDTPTVDDGRGVNPICTRDPACPLHDRTQSSVLAAGQPIAYLIGTPAYCKTAVCGPVLDLLLDEQDSRPDIAMIHAEVYTDDTIEVVAPAVTAYSLNFEPVLFVADASGTLVARLDSIWDASELTAALDLAGAG